MYLHNAFDNKDIFYVSDIMKKKKKKVQKVYCGHEGYDEPYEE